jgi:hypothetical protein
VTRKSKTLRIPRAVRQSPKSGKSRVKLPDFRARVRAIYGDKVFKVSDAEVVRQDRDRY